MRSILRTLDSTFLRGAIRKLLLILRRHAEVKIVRNSCSETYSVFYNKHTNFLPMLCYKYGSDKGSLHNGENVYPWPAHTYADYYSRTFAHCRSGVRRIFECGIGTNNPNLLSSMGLAGRPGASLRVWRDYFPEAVIFGGDIDNEILFQEDRISTFYIDQLDPSSINEFWNLVGITDFDLMIDDGLHTFEAATTLFSYSIDRLAKTGIYFIEDVLKTDLLKFNQFFEQFEYLVDYVPSRQSLGR